MMRKNILMIKEEKEMEKDKVGDLIKLENGKEYVCAMEIKDNNFNYLYLITKTKPIEVKFEKYNPKEDMGSIILIGEKKEKQYILNLFQNKIEE